MKTVFYVITVVALITCYSCQNKEKPIESIVVLTPHNLTVEKNMKYSIMGIHNRLIHELGQITNLKVMSRTTSSEYQDTDLTANKMAYQLKVDAVLESELLEVGDTICIKVKLIRLNPEEKLLWEDTFKEAKRNDVNLYNQIRKKVEEKVEVR